MSETQATPSLTIPRPPKDIHVRSSRDLNVGSTGLEPSSYLGRSALRNRRRKHPEHNIPPIKPTDKLFAYFGKKAEAHSDSQCVFLLWGSEDSGKSATWAIDARISDSDAEETAFRELKEAYYAKRGRWRKYLSLRDVSQVIPVKVR
jgi:hypothetical protein